MTGTRNLHRRLSGMAAIMLVVSLLMVVLAFTTSASAGVSPQTNCRDKVIDQYRVCNENRYYDYYYIHCWYCCDATGCYCLWTWTEGPFGSSYPC